MDAFFAYFLAKPTDSEDISTKKLAWSKWFIYAIPETEFEGIERLTYHYIEMFAQLGQVLRMSDLVQVMSIDLKSYLHESRIQLPGTEAYSMSDQTQVAQLIATTKEVATVMLTEFINNTTVDYSSFAIQAKFFFDTKREARLVEMYSKGFQMISTPSKEGFGHQAAFDYSKETLATINEIYDQNKLHDLGDNDVITTPQPKFLTETSIPTLDNDCVGLFTTQLFGVEAPPGEGKTRFALTCFVYPALVNHNRNVLYFALEQSEAEIEAILVSHHLFRTTGLRVSDSDIYKGRVTDKDILEKIGIARYGLFDSGTYGNLKIMGEQLYINDFIDKIKVIDKLHGPFDIVVIDYMFLLRHQPKKYERVMDRTEIIRQGYQDFKAYLRKYDKGGVAINQLNREGIQAARSDKEIDETMAAGGIEVYRSTDYNIVITATAVMKTQRKRKLQNPKVRGSAGYGSVIVNVALDVSYYAEEE